MANPQFVINEAITTISQIYFPVIIKVFDDLTSVRHSSVKFYKSWRKYQVIGILYFINYCIAVEILNHISEQFCLQNYQRL